MGSAKSDGRGAVAAVENQMSAKGQMTESGVLIGLAYATLVQRPEMLPPAGSPAADFMAGVAERTREICAFYLARKNGRVFVEGHDERWIFRYIAFHLLSGNIFVVRERGAIAGVAVAWPDRAANIFALEAAGEPQFNWRQNVEPGDAVFIGPMIGTRACGYGWRKLALQRWPDLAARRVFAQRRERLVEISAGVVKRFAKSTTEAQRHRGTEGKRLPLCVSVPLW